MPNGRGSVDRTQESLYREAMTLNAVQYDLLRMYAAAGPAEVAIFETPPPPGAREDDPLYESWAAEQCRMYEAAVSLYARGLLAVVSPATGKRTDIVEVTDRGRTLLAQAAG